MKDKIKKLIEELSRALAGVDPDNISPLLPQLEEILQCSSEDPSLETLHNAAEFGISQLTVIPPAERFEFVKKLVQTFHELVSVAQTTRVITQLDSDSMSGYSEELPDVNEFFDEEFLVDFIEQHVNLLEEFEAYLLSYALKTSLDEESLDDLQRFVKSYLHNIKGDSGTIGLCGIERVSHALEDILEERHAIELIDEFLEFKAWVLDCTDSIHNGDAPSMSSAAFLFNIQEKISEQRDVALDKIAASEVVEPESSDTNKSQARDTTKIRTFIKVDTAKLDSLIELIGEMIISSSMLAEDCRKFFHQDEEVMKNTDQLEQISRDVRDTATSLRLVPISGVFQKMSRIAFEAGNKLGKRVRLEIEGEETELDRTVFEKIIDPLMHMVRNSIAHGIEEPSERVMLGKDESGLIRLSAYHHGDNIRIRVSDDGRGLNVGAIKKRAVENGLIAPNNRLKDVEVFQLIFEPGFSTAESVSDIAGRGVGMDVVKKNIESMRGRILIESNVGEGTEFTIELPLTVGVIDGILVRIGQEKYILPMISIVEFLEAERQTIHRVIGEGCLIKYRDTIVPVFSIADLFEARNSFSEHHTGAFVISERDGAFTAFQVDEILGTCSTIIKSLNNSYSSIPGVAGAAIMSDGKASLILDLSILADVARNINLVTEGGVDDSGRV